MALDCKPIHFKATLSEAITMVWRKDLSVVGFAFSVSALGRKEAKADQPIARRNLRGALPMLCPRRWLAGAGILFAVFLSGCVPNWPTDDWSGYVSKDKPLRFLAAASCDVPWPLNPVSADAAFFQVTDLRPVQGRPWGYDVGYITGDGAQHDRFDITQWWTAAGRRTSTQSGERQRCAVLVDIPKSKNADRPYFYTNDAQARTAEHDALVLTEQRVSYMLGALFFVVLIPSFFGFERSHDMPAGGKWVMSIWAAISVIGVSLMVGDMCLSEPWRTFEKARQYYTWFDELPRSRSGLLLPISPQQLNFLVAGPPHPTAMQATIDPYGWATGALAGIWLAVVLPAFVKGLYWICTPLPLEQAHRQALRESRRLTAEEIVNAMNKAVAGKSAWQLNIMRRKAEAFARTFGYVADRDS